MILNVLLMTFVQRGCLFFITYLVLVSFDVRHVGMVEAVTLQAMISVAVDMLPLPAGHQREHLLSGRVPAGVRSGADRACPDRQPRNQLLIRNYWVSAAFTVVAYLRIFRGGEKNDWIL